MTPFAASPALPSATHLVVALLAGAAGMLLILPRPKGRRVAFGAFLLIAALAIVGVWTYRSFGEPSTDAVGRILFWFFGGTSAIFATALVTQSNPARGAIAFAFVIISVCGLFLTLAAPFLAAATVVVYAGAIIVTFLFVLMLSHAEGPSDENDRSREPLMGALAGFAFTGLILFAVQHASAGDAPLPTPTLTFDERSRLIDAAGKLVEIAETEPAKIAKAADAPRSTIDAVLMSIETRFRFLEPPVPPFDETARRIESVRKASKSIENSLVEPKANPKDAVVVLANEVRLLAGSSELPARNVGTVGFLLYSEYLLTVEMAGTLLLVATIGAVAIAAKRGGAA
jgi:NADH:ubiquinone oxidoreductase subunit 6 (subunit J)